MTNNGFASGMIDSFNWRFNNSFVSFAAVLSRKAKPNYMPGRFENEQKGLFSISIKEKQDNMGSIYELLRYLPPYCAITDGKGMLLVNGG